MVKRIGLAVLVVLILGAMSTGVLFAAGADPRIPLLESNVEIQVASPFEVTLVQSGTELKLNKGRATAVYPGQKIAGGVVQIKNVSPFVYGFYFRAEPQKVLGESLPSFDIKTWVGNTQLDRLNNIPPGATMQVRVEIFVPYGRPPTSFQGLNIIVEVGPSSP